MGNPGRPRKMTRNGNNRARYFDHPLDTSKPIPIEIHCPTCTALRHNRTGVFHFDMARDAGVLIFLRTCPWCGTKWRIRVKLVGEKGLDVQFRVQKGEDWD